MSRQFKITSTIIKKAKDSGNPIYFMIGIFFLLVIALIILICIPIVFLFSLFYKYFPSKSAQNHVSEDEWIKIHSTKDLIIFMQYVDDVSFGPPDWYYRYKTEPHLPVFEELYFSEYIWPVPGGLFLQQWNDTDKPDSSLLFFDTFTYELITILPNIPSVWWFIEMTGENFQLRYDYEDHTITYIIDFSTRKVIKTNNASSTLTSGEM